MTRLLAAGLIAACGSARIAYLARRRDRAAAVASDMRTPPLVSVASGAARTGAGPGSPNPDT